MFTNTLEKAPKRTRKGLVSYILLQKDSVQDTGLAVTWVEVAPGARQERHHHIPQQIYVVIQGEGLMHIGDERQELKRGSLAFIPSQAMHGIDNTGDEPLVYVSASSPAFDLEALYDSGSLAKPPAA